MAMASPNKCNPKSGPDKTSKESPLRELADSFHDFSKDRGCENYRGVGTDLIELIGNSYIFKVDEITKEHLPDPVKLKETIPPPTFFTPDSSVDAPVFTPDSIF